MRPQLLSEPIPYQQQLPEWNPALHIAFRFSVADLGVFCAAANRHQPVLSATQGSDIPDPGTLWPLRPLVVWTAGHIFHVAAPLSLEGNSASGDCMFGWLTAFCLLVVAAFATPRAQLFSSLRANRIALAAQVILGLWLLGLNLHTVRQAKKARCP